MNPQRDVLRPFEPEGCRSCREREERGRISRSVGVSHYARPSLIRKLSGRSVGRCRMPRRQRRHIAATALPFAAQRRGQKYLALYFGVQDLCKALSISSNFVLAKRKEELKHIAHEPYVFHVLGLNQIQILHLQFMKR